MSGSVSGSSSSEDALSAEVTVSGVTCRSEPRSDLSRLSVPDYAIAKWEAARMSEHHSRRQLLARVVLTRSSDRRF